MRSHNESAFSGIDHCLGVVTLHRAPASAAHAPALRFTHTGGVAPAPASGLIAPTGLTSCLSSSQNGGFSGQEFALALRAIAQLDRQLRPASVAVFGIGCFGLL